jgi:CheY-like chemotaxis protein
MAGTAHKLLVVDDEKKVLTLTKKMLAPEAYEVMTAQDVEEALDIIEEKGPFSVVLSDNRMPAMRGTEFFKKIKTLCPNTVRILMTAHYDAQLIEDVVNSGEAFRYLKKPLDFKLVKRTLQEGMEQYEKNIEVESLGSELENLNQEKKSLQAETMDRDEAIAKLHKTKKVLAVGILSIFLAGGLFYGYTIWDENERMKSTQIVIGDWVKYENETSLDKTTGKIWMNKDFRMLENRQPNNWEEAIAWAEKMNKKRYAGFSDWRIPTIKELEETYNPESGQVAFDKNEKFKVGYPQAFEDGGGYGYWSSDVIGLNSAKYFFFVGGYSKGERKDYHNPTISARLVRN